jgi:hypothetical protein
VTAKQKFAIAMFRVSDLGRCFGSFCIALALGRVSEMTSEREGQHGSCKEVMQMFWETDGPEKR